MIRRLLMAALLASSTLANAASLMDMQRQQTQSILDSTRTPTQHQGPIATSHYVDPLAAVAPQGPPPPRDKAGEATVTGATFTYTQDGQRESITLSNGIVTRYRYDRRDRLVDLHTKTKEGLTIQHHVYTLDASGLRTGVDSTDADGNTRTTAYVYDALTRLTSEVQKENGVEVFNATYTYDRVGNRKSATVNGVVTTYTYDVVDSLISETTVGGPAPGTTTYTYDKNGNRLTKTGPLGHVEYQYDDANRMTVLLDGTDRIEFGYDADGLLRRKTFYKAGMPPLAQRFVWDANRSTPQVFEELVSEDGAPPRLVANYLFADDLIAQTRNGVTSFVITDGMGSTRALADTGGSVTDTFRYDAFGNVIGRSGSTPIDHLYRGEQLDPNTGFYYLRARWADPKIGAFTQMDSFAGFAADPPSLHKYAFNHNDPVNRIDPSGHFSLTEFNTVVTIIGIGNASINAGFKIAEGDYRGAAEGVVRDAVFWALGAGAGKLVAPLGQSAMGLFSKVFMVPLQQGVARSSAVLTRNMEAVMAKVGMTKFPGWQAHHIVGEAYPEGKAAMEILRRFKIDVNSPLNGVFLPGCGSFGSTGKGGLAVHCGKHVQQYEQYVLAELQAAKSEVDAINILARIRAELIDRELFLNARGNL